MQVLASVTACLRCICKLLRAVERSSDVEYD